MPYNSNDFKLISYFYNIIASDKQKYYIERILKKDKPSAWDKQLLDTCIRQMNVRLTAVSTNVDSRLRQLKKDIYKRSVIDNRKVT